MQTFKTYERKTAILIEELPGDGSSFIVASVHLHLGTGPEGDLARTRARQRAELFRCALESIAREVEELRVEKVRTGNWEES